MVEEVLLEADAAAPQVVVVVASAVAVVALVVVEVCARYCRLAIMCRSILIQTFLSSTGGGAPRGRGGFGGPPRGGRGAPRGW